jgi:hypothetical protein
MKRIALFAALATAVPAVAFAQNVPQQTYDRDRDRDHVRDRDRDHQDAYNRDHYDRYDRSHWATDFRGRWVPLASGYSGRTDRQFINVGNGRYRKIRIEAVRGEPVVTKIAIEFADHTTQAVDLDSRLTRGAGDVIDLNGGVRQIHRIIVYTDRRGGGSYSVYGA